MPELNELIHYQQPSGRVEWIGLARQRRGEMELPRTIEVEIGSGIIGEHHARSGRSPRQISLMQYEHLAVVARLLGKPEILPHLLRRNIVVSGINLIALKGQRFQIGSAILVGGGPCAPCSRMEENLGPGGYAAMRGHGGIVAIVERAGQIGIGDEVRQLPKIADGQPEG